MAASLSRPRGLMWGPATVIGKSALAGRPASQVAEHPQGEGEQVLGDPLDQATDCLAR